MPPVQEETPTIPITPPTPPHISPAQWALLLVLAAVQFTNCVDFVIMMPLGPRYQRELNITITEFGFLVSAYTYAAAISGLLAALVVDRFDRKRTLMVLYAGFTVGTLGCALAPTYETLLAARCVAGASGGVLGGVVLAIVGDMFVEERRGLATGIVMSAFSAAMIAGVPAGLVATHFGPTGTAFALLAGLSALCWVGTAFLLPPLHRHLTDRSDLTRVAPWRVLLVPAHLWAYLLMILLVMGSFTLVPYLPTYLRFNVGLGEEYLPLMYLCGGLATLATNSVFGRLADRFGKLQVFRVAALLTMVPILWLTNLTWEPVALTLAVTTLYMVMTSGRMVPAMALITSSARSEYRGSFMSVNFAVQQIALGLATQVASLFLHQADKDAPMEGYPLVGLMACAATVASIVLAGRLRPVAGPAATHEPYLAGVEEGI